MILFQTHCNFTNFKPSSRPRIRAFTEVITRKLMTSRSFSNLIGLHCTLQTSRIEFVPGPLLPEKGRGSARLTRLHTLELTGTEGLLGRAIVGELAKLRLKGAGDPLS